ncbi:hypothetical protein BH23BAC3_BH23BAC3_15220 [soil metagenome]
MSKNERFDAYNLLIRFREGDLSPENEKKALHLIAEDEELRSMLRFDSFLSNSLSEKPSLESYSVPVGFTDDVMSQILKMEEESSPEVSWFDSLLQTVNEWFAPREYTFRPALVYIIPAVLLIAYAGMFKGGHEPTGFTADRVGMDADTESSTEIKYTADDPLLSEEVWIRFVYIDEEAERVAVAGNFSDWEPVEMSSQLMNGKKVWTGLIPVERGEHHYMFIKDGEEWISDPLAEVQRDDGFGNKNAVIFL